MLVDQLLFESEALAAGSHTLKVRVKGTKNAASSGTEVIVDAFACPTGGPRAARPAAPSCANSGTASRAGRCTT
jgi:hypothetical protein